MSPYFAEPESPPEILANIPYNREAEDAVIGAILIDPSAFPDLATFLQPQDFYIYRHRWLWEAFAHLQDADTPIDYITVITELERVGKLVEVGGEAYLTSLLNAPPSSQHAGRYAQMVKEQAMKRQLFTIANQIANDACSNHLSPDQIAARALVDLGKIKPVNVKAAKNRWMLTELMEAEFPDLGGLIPGLIPLGLTVFGARPKRGKSWLMMQAGGSLAMGGKFFGHDLQISRVLYFALEDPPRRLKERMQKLGIDPSALIEFKTEIKPLHLGGISEIAAEAKAHQLIVLDTIRRALPGKDFTKDGALFDDILGQLQTIGQSANMAVVVILHTRKSTAGFDPDPVDDVLGSTGLTASADCVLALYKTNNAPDARLLGRRRDGEDIDLTISFDHTTCAWQLKGETEKVRITECENEILTALAYLGKVKASAIASAIVKNRGNTTTRLQALWTCGKVKRELIENIAYYSLAEDK